MADIITETLLEMHFHKALVAHFEKKYGARFLKLLKPSTRNEAWVGYDQGWVRTSLGTEEFFNELKKTIHLGGEEVKHFYIGYFLQFKKVDLIRRRSRHMPSDYSVPYYRCELSLEPNKITKLSQHETLIRLGGIKGASVSYACPMFFDIDNIYKDADLDDLRIIPVNGSPTGWLTSERHFICFRGVRDSNPKWCSDPVDGVSYSVDEWSSEGHGNKPVPIHGADVIHMIMQTIQTLSKRKWDDAGQRKRITELLPESLTFIEFRG